METNITKPVQVPEDYNYIGVFLTFACNLKCHYCINHFEQGIIKRKNISGKDWVRGLNRIISREDLPITLQGGEPSLHPDFIYIINNIKPDLYIEILTNLRFDIDEFKSKVDPERLRRDAPYASIRVSYHPEQMDLDETIHKTSKLLKANFSIGIWGVMRPGYEKIMSEAQSKARKEGIDFRMKEFLGEYKKKLYGTYRYSGVCDKKFRKKVQCKTTEFLIDSEGSVFRCHADIYERLNPIGHILSPDFQIENKFRDCSNFGHCNPCDVKVKTNRYQQYGHTSVEVKGIK
ncbi:MAG TPA: radical SAM protein [Candidatus Omnitrophica bacterium]|nr:radical SAM protein [Candidatus Omnitrophota bacterium]